MATKKILNITSPVGRLVAGSLYDGRDRDWENKPYVYKSGANIGKPRTDFSFGLAIKKNPGESHWSQHPFFAPIWAFGHAEYPAGDAQQRDFAWKIEDGDSTELNKAKKRNSEREGFPGHWIIWFSGSQAPRVYNANGTQLLLEKDAVRRGYYIQVFGNITNNQPSQSPGIYVNHSMVAFAAYGEEISSGPDVSQAGFGQGAVLPAGASLAPPAGAVPSTGAMAPPPPPPAYAAPPSIPGTIAPPPPPPAYVAPPPPPAAPARQMTAKANGATYQSFIDGGWTEQAMIADGYLLAAVPPPLPVGSAPTLVPPAPIAVAPPPLPVIPNAAILAVPPAPGAIAPPPPPLPVAPAVRLVEGKPITEWYAGGWTDALLIQHGKLAA